MTMVKKYQSKQKKSITSAGIPTIKNKDIETNLLEFLMTYGWAILVVLVVIGALLLFGVFPGNSYCDTHPEKCVLEPTEKFLESGAKPTIYSSQEEYCLKHPIENIPEGYCKYRQKTSAELEADICTILPFDFQNCRCTQIPVTKPFCYNIVLCNPNNLNCSETVTCSYLAPELTCPEARPLTECEKKNSDFKCSNPGGDADGNYYCNPESCIAKTECEKITEGWREEPRFDISCTHKEYAPLSGFNASSKDIQTLLNYGFTCSINKQYTTCFKS